MKEGTYKALGVDPITEKTELWFGKYKGFTLKHILNKDAPYLEWCIKKDIFTVSKDLKKLITEQADLQNLEKLEERWYLMPYEYYD
jgi:uncharacterized protein (DUF3820 family)